MQKTFKTARDIKLNRVLLREAMQIKISIKMAIDLANIFTAFVAHFNIKRYDQFYTEIVLSEH